VRGYLLDTNILRFWFDESCPEHLNVVGRMKSLEPGTPLRISAISLGEMEYGHRCVADEDTTLQLKFKQFISTRLPEILKIQRSTSTYYGQIRARLFKRFAPKNSRKNLRPCQLIDPVTATELGIQENDLWIASQANEYNLVIVTHDKMSRVKEVAGDLINFEDWAV
jgi:predicted nucleic acid-binding protein